MENDRFRLKFDTQKGGLCSFFDKDLKREWFDSSAGYPFNGFLHEEVADKDYPWPRWLMFHMDWGSDQVERERGWKPSWRANRAQSSQVLTHRVYMTPYGRRVVQILEAPGIQGPLIQSVFLPDGGDYIECESWWIMTLTTHPEATYVLFPFDIPGAKARIDLGGQAMIAGEDQIQGVCYDYFTAQQWVDFSNDTEGVTIALPDNPMVQFGDFHFGHNQQQFTLDRALLLGWVTNTYWETNFRTHQPGGVHARYRIYPHQGGFDKAAAQRRGLETAASQPLLQHMGEPAPQPIFPLTGALLTLPESTAPAAPVFTLHIQPAQKGSGVLVRLYNASDLPQEAIIGSGLLHIVAAQQCDLTGNPFQALPCSEGALTVTLAPRRVSTFLLGVKT